MTTEADRPKVPRPRRSVFRFIALAFTVAVVGGYAAIAYSGRELAGDDKDQIPASMRATPGGYRSYSYWHSGYHGGK